jgi:mannose-6-phosphate isomerase-like protein (cupin superfamily)
MYIVHHAHLRQQRSDGEQRFAAADKSLGVKHFEVWMRKLEPGAHSLEKRHAGELVVLVLTGCGKLLVDGGPQRFHAPCSLLIPPGCVFRIANHGSAALQLVWTCTDPPRPVACPPESGGPSPGGPWLLQPMPGSDADGTLATMPCNDAASRPQTDIDEDRS